MVRILAIDDDKPTLLMIKKGLVLAGHKLILAESGAEGIRLAKKKKPDLILLDIMMPEMDGMEVCFRLKNNWRTRQIPIFMLTARNQMKDIEMALDLGADNYITKPFGWQELNNIISFKMNAQH